MYPVILAGGLGTRLWPMSRSAHPKQLQPLYSARPMIADTALRVTGSGMNRPLVVCNEQHRFSIAAVLKDVDVAVDTFLLEPEGRNTAPALAAAALVVSAADPEGLLLVLPSDHVITDEPAFREVVARAAEAAARGYLVTFGITPTRPETGYGYIRAGQRLEWGEGIFHVASFKEKPDARTATAYVADGSYTWNSGMFVLPARVLLAELEAFCPSVLDSAQRALESGQRAGEFWSLNKEAFAAAPAISIDVAVMEKTGRAAVVPADMGWSDIGAWTALWDIAERDGSGNVCMGDVITHDVHGSYVRSENGRLVAVDGLTDVVVVATDDAVLVTTQERAQNVKSVVDILSQRGRPEVRLHSLVHRPWGYYRSIDSGDRYQVKQIMVKPGAQLSLQYHHHRAEHWIVVEGTARVTRGDEVFLLRENESTFIRIGEVHRLENPGLTPLRLIEVQSGGYLGEDDIVRLDDTYGRNSAE